MEVRLNIYLIRHGEKSGDGLSLSRRGIEQINFLSARLKKLNIGKIYSSDLERCRESAEIIRKKLNLEIVYDATLREVDDDVRHNPSEHSSEIKAIKKFWKKIIKDKESVLIVGSGNVNRIILAIALGISPQKARFMYSPSGMSHLEFMGDRTRAGYINDTGHLPENLRIRQDY